jgi:homogentisate 1,2-dioxygenase
MVSYHSMGSILPKRHTQHRTPGGGLCYEELVGEDQAYAWSWSGWGAAR